MRTGSTKMPSTRDRQMHEVRADLEIAWIETKCPCRQEGVNEERQEEGEVE